MPRVDVVRVRNNSPFELSTLLTRNDSFLGCRKIVRSKVTSHHSSTSLAKIPDILGKFASGRASSHALVSGVRIRRVPGHTLARRETAMMSSQTGWRRRVATYALCAGAGYYGTHSSLPFPPLAARAPRFGEFPRPTFRPTRLLTPRTSSPSPFFSVVQRVSQSERARQLYTATIGYTSAALAVSEMVSKLTTDVNDFINAEPDAPIRPRSARRCA